MKKLLVSLVCIVSFLELRAQTENKILHQQNFIANIGYACEETPEPDPCAGLEIYLVLSFTKDNVSILEKEISTCGTEYITSKYDYKWELTQNSEIKINTNTQEIKNEFLKDVVLKLENKKVLGYKIRENKITDTIEFKSIEIISKQ